MRSSALILSVVCCCLARAIGAGEALFDTVLRYVNEDPVTVGEVRVRTMQRTNRLGQARPTTPDEQRAMLRETLEELTDETLLLQQAEKLGVSLDRDLVLRAIQRQNRQRGGVMTLAEQAEERQRIERQEKIRAVLRYFEERSPAIAPDALWAVYESRRDKLRRPARLHLYQILVRVAGRDDERRQLDAENDLLARAGRATDAAVAALAKQRLEAALDDKLSLAERNAVVTEAAAAIAALDPAQLDAAGKDIVRDAGRAVAARAALRTQEQCVAELRGLREQLQGKGVDAFAEASRKVSQGPRANDGGDLGWLEPEGLKPAFAERVAGLRAGQLSEVFASDDVVVLLLVAEREDAAPLSFAQVSGEIESELRQLRSAEVRRMVAGTLRSQASIRDAPSAEALLR